MARVTVEDCLKHVANRFILIHGAIQRATQLKKGAAPLVNAPGEKPTVVSLREIGHGKIKVTERVITPRLPEDTTL